MDSWKSRGGKRQRREEKRREEKRREERKPEKRREEKKENQRREEKRRKKIREEKESEERRCRRAKKVEKMRNTVFSNVLWLRRVEKYIGSLKRRVRSHLRRLEMKNCTPLWHERHLQAKMRKAPRWKLRCSTVHAVLARSKFPKQNGKNTTFSVHLWTFKRTTLFNNDNNKKPRGMVAKMWKDSRGSRTLQKSEIHVDLCHSARSMVQKSKAWFKHVPNCELYGFMMIQYDSVWWCLNSLFHQISINLLGHLCLAKWLRINFIYCHRLMVNDLYLTIQFKKTCIKFSMSCTFLSLGISDAPPREPILWAESCKTMVWL